ncbi:MAG: LLM class F420-dependent oxidoreductase [Pseudomonadales bacterium]
MKVGIMAGATSAFGNGIADLVEFTKNAENMGFDSVWMANIFGPDAINTLSIAGWETERIELGTAVVPTYPRHPTAIAQQAMTAAAASNNRFSLGIGLSHKLVIEDMLGMSYDKPAKHMREYLSILAPLLRCESASFAGEQYTAHVGIRVDGAKNVPLIVAALGPAMLKLAGTMADGTITWMTGSKTIAEHIAPSINAAADQAGKPQPRVVCGLPIALTSDIDGAKAKIGEQLKMYGELPSYRAMLDKEGAAGPADVAILGDEAAIRQQLQSLKDAGVTDFNAALIDLGNQEHARTMEFLAAEIS